MKKTYKHGYKSKYTFVATQMAAAMLLVVWGRQGGVGSLFDVDFGVIPNT